VIRRWSLLALCAAAGCGDGGSFIYVHTHDPAIQHIELFIGRDACVDRGQPCAVRPPTVDAHMPVGSAGGAWLREISGLFDADVHGGVAKFKVTGTGTAPVQIIAVGYGVQTSNGTPTAIATGLVHDLVVSADSGEVISVDLVPAKPLDANEETGGQDGDFVYVWNNFACDPSTGTCPPPGDCVIAEHRAKGVETLDVIVPDGDEDCDGVPTLDPLDASHPNPAECDWLWPDVMGQPGLVSASDCAAHDSVNGAATCLLAGGACTDGVGADASTCTAIHSPEYCLPDAVCGTSCARPGSPYPVGDCLTDTVNATTPVAAMHCKIFVDTQGRPCPTATTLQGDLNASPLFLNPHVCVDVRFATDSLQAFSSRSALRLGGADFDLPITSAVPGDGTSCDFSIAWQGQFSGGVWQGHDLQPLQIGDVVWMLADLEVDNHNHMLLPVKFDIAQADCIQAGPALYCVPISGFPGTVTVVDGITNCSL
jgi:hypothetical protein